MATEACEICGDSRPFDDTVHVMIHTNAAAGVIDGYVCRPCYQEHLAPLFAASTDETD